DVEGVREVLDRDLWCHHRARREKLPRRRFMRTLGALLDDQAMARPHAEAVVFRDQRLTYAGLRARVDEFAKALLAAGVTRGCRGYAPSSAWTIRITTASFPCRPSSPPPRAPRRWMTRGAPFALTTSATSSIRRAPRRRRRA